LVLKKVLCISKEVFEKLKEAGEIIGLKVLDSIIFNEREFYSQITK